jgi:hypothetical protein
LASDIIFVTAITAIDKGSEQLPEAPLVLPDIKRVRSLLGSIVVFSGPLFIIHPHFVIGAIVCVVHIGVGVVVCIGVAIVVISTSDVAPQTAAHVVLLARLLVSVVSVVPLAAGEYRRHHHQQARKN